MVFFHFLIRYCNLPAVNLLPERLPETRSSADKSMKYWVKIREGLISAIHAFVDLDSGISPTKREKLTAERAIKKELRFEKDALRQQRRIESKARKLESIPNIDNFAINAPPPLPPVRITPMSSPPPVNQTLTVDQEIAVLITYKKRWDVVDKRLNELRERGWIVGRISSKDKAAMLLHIEEGYDLLQFIRSNYPQYLCAPVSYNPPAKKGCLNLILLIMAPVALAAGWLIFSS